MRLTGGSNIANGRAGTPSVGPPAGNRREISHALPDWATRVICSQLTRSCTISPGTPARGATACCREVFPRKRARLQVVSQFL